MAMQWRAGAGRPSRVAGALVFMLAMVAGAAGGGMPAEAAGGGVDLAKLVAPAGTIVFGGIDDATSLFEAARALAERVSPGSVPPIAPADLVVAGARGVDLVARARFAVFDPEKYSGNGLAIIVALADKKAFVDALPAPVKKRDRGNALSWNAGADQFANFVGKSVVITRHPDVFRERAIFLKKLAATSLPAPAAMVVPVRALVEKYGTMLDAALTGMKAEMEKSKPAGGAPTPDVSGWLGDTARALERIVVTGQLSGDGVMLRAEVTPRAVSTLAGVVGKLSGRGFALLDRLPADAAAFMAWSVDPASLAAGMRPLMDWSASAAFAGGSAPPAWLKMMDSFWATATGEGVFGVFPPRAGKSATMAMAMGVTDDAAARSWMDGMGAVMADPAVKKTYADLGMEVKYNKDAYRIAGAPVATSTIKRIARPAGSTAPVVPPEAAKWMDEYMGSYAMTVAKGLSCMSFGKAARASLEALILAGASGLSADAGVKHALSAAAPGTFLIFFARTADLVRVIDGFGVGSGKPSATPAAGPPAIGAPGYALSMGAHAGALTLALELPAPELSLAAEAFRKYVEKAKSVGSAPEPAVPPRR